MNVEAILLSVVAFGIYGVILGCAKHRLFWWYVLCTAVGSVLKWSVIGWYGYSSAEYYYVYHGVAYLHPVFQMAISWSLYRRRTPDSIRWLSTSCKVGMFGAVVWQSGLTLESVHTLLVFAQFGFGIIVLAQVMLTGARIEPEEGGIFAGVLMSSWLSLCLYGVATFGGIEQWRAWIQQASLLPWMTWGVTALRAHSSVRKGVAAVTRGPRTWTLRAAQGLRTIRQRLVRPRTRQLQFSFDAPFEGQYRRRG